MVKFELLVSSTKSIRIDNSFFQKKISTKKRAILRKAVNISY